MRIDRSTRFTFSVAPDASWAAVCALGFVWRLDLDGDAPAQRLTDETHDAQHPWIAGDWIYFQSFATGFWQIAAVPVRGGPVATLTSGSYDHRDPTVHNGRLVISADLRSQAELWSYAIDGLTVGEPELLRGTDSEPLTCPRFGPDGSLAVQVGRHRLDVMRDGVWSTALEVSGADRLYGGVCGPGGPLAVVARSVDAMPVPTADAVDLVVGGRILLGGRDVQPAAPQWLYDGSACCAADGVLTIVGAGPVRSVNLRLPVDLPPRRSTPSPRRPGSETWQGLLDITPLPDGNLVVRAAGRIWNVDPTGTASPLTPPDGHWRAGVALDGSSLVFESDRSGSMQLWRLDMTTGTEEPLTERDGAPHAAAVADDGTLAWFDVEENLWVGDRLVAGPFGETGRPRWLPGNRYIAFAASLRRSEVGRHGTHAIAVVDTADGSVAYHVPSVGGLSSRRGCGPEFSPDGRHAAVVVDGLLYVMDVHRTPDVRRTTADSGSAAGDRGDGAPGFGAARLVAEESADWPVFGWDGVLMALHHGRLRRYPAGEKPHDVLIRFPGSARVAAAPSAVRAGRIWDGVADGYRQGGDIVIRDGRIAEIAELGSYDGPGLVEEPELTAIPGLFDAHTHVTLAGAECLGQALAEQYLAHGVTGLRSMGESLYHAVEFREAAAAGVRAAPRLFVCGELLDGEQIVGDNRSIRDLAALDREIERHLALGVDIAKAYVRMAPALHRHLIERFAAAGVPVAGHYLYPNLWFGQGSVEHFGSPSRYPVNALVTLTGRSYDDVTAPFEAGSIALCPTLFNSRALAQRVGDDSWDADPRTARMPGWQREKFAIRLGPEQVSAISQTGLKRHAQTIAAILSAGGTVFSGTDVPHEVPGLGVHLNMRALVLGGARPIDVLRGASLGVAEWLGADVGPIAAGRPADFSLVAGDPLADIADAAATRWTIVDGRPYRREA